MSFRISRWTLRASCVQLQSDEFVFLNLVEFIKNAQMQLEFSLRCEEAGPGHHCNLKFLNADPT